MGLVVSAGLRCDDCINYHVIQSYRLGATRTEQEEALNVALVVGRQHRDSTPAPGLCTTDGVVRMIRREISCQSAT